MKGLTEATDKMKLYAPGGYYPDGRAKPLREVHEVHDWREPFYSTGDPVLWVSFTDAPKIIEAVSAGCFVTA